MDVSRVEREWVTWSDAPHLMHSHCDPLWLDDHSHFVRNATVSISNVFGSLPVNDGDVTCHDETRNRC